jgi:hypothetical protein
VSGRNDRGAVGTGIFFLIAGVLFLLDQLNVVDLRGSYLLPALLIAFGVALLVGTRR